MTTRLDAAPVRPFPGRDTQVENRKSSPVLWWAGIGVVFTGLALYVQGSWVIEIIGGRATPIGPGVTPVPTSVTIAARANEALFALGIPALLFFLVLRPKRRDGRISFDGLLYLSFFSVWWQDPLFNYLTTGFTYNAAMLNVGGWAHHIPGWNSPNGQQFLEPIVWDLGFYVVLSVLAVIGASNLMLRIKAHRPQITTGTLFVGLFVVVLFADFLLEFFWVRTGLYAYAGTIDAFTIFPDKFYRFPLYEPLLCAPLFVGWTAVRFFRDDKGRSFVERGIDQVRAGPSAKTAIRYFALVGVLNLIFLFGNNVPVQFWQLHADSWPKALQQRSYYTHGMCGEGTTYPCAGTDIAIPRRGKAIHLGPDGKVVVPPGVELPELVELNTR